MTNEELKKKILEIFDKAIGDWYEKDDGLFADGYTPEEGDNRFKAFIADALIAAGIGDVLEEKSKAFVYANEIAYLDNQLKEYKHRAEVAERALLTACVNLIKNEKANVNNVNMELLVRVVYTNYLRKAEKELAEGKKE